MSRAAMLETPSGKAAGDENFPVGSWLLPAKLRPHVAIFYAFARAIDDIADNPALAPDDKIRRLDLFDQALQGHAADAPGVEKARALRASMAATSVPIAHGRDLIDAFKQDAVKLRYDDWDDLIGYCMRSAAPVGRYLLDLHGEDKAAWAASDPLCNALQVLNHLQDCQDDYRRLDRVYIPADAMARHGMTVADLDRAAASPAVRAVLDELLDGTDRLLVAARTLPARLKSRRLAMESAVTVRLALRLAALLRRGDPLAGRVALTRPDLARAGLAGVVVGLFGRV